VIAAAEKCLIEDRVWLISKLTGVPAYDFDVRLFFSCRHPYESAGPLPGIARIGAFQDYEKFYREAASLGIQLANTPEEHELCSNLPSWYPKITEVTPRSIWYETLPPLTTILKDFAFPFFLKGARQTSRHRADASIIGSPTDYERAAEIFKRDPILRWQEVVCREFVPLRRIPGGLEGKVPASFEFRTFWWKTKLVGSGRYWFEAPNYAWTAEEEAQALVCAQLAVDRLNCGFVVIDLAMTVTGQWIVIECNDGMESGYAGVSPMLLWRSILDHETQSNPKH
jgi:hypothetical protein